MVGLRRKRLDQELQDLIDNTITAHRSVIPTNSAILRPQLLK